jgi:hypothetical protein
MPIGILVDSFWLHMDQTEVFGEQQVLLLYRTDLMLQLTMFQ